MTIERVRFDEIGGSVMDIEPDYDWSGAADVMVRDNTIGSYGLTRPAPAGSSPPAGAAGSTVRDVSIIGNTISGTARSGYEGKPLALHVKVCGEVGPRTDFVIRDNTSSRTDRRRVHAGHLPQPRRRGHRHGQPPAGRLGRAGDQFPGSSGVTYSGNNTSP